MQSKERLLLGCLDRHEAHVRTLNCLTNRLGITGIILIRFDVRFNELWRHQ
jgi:hypothetical protein